MPTYKYLNDTGLERTLSKLKTYIDSQSGGGSDGHGFIICDTSTMQVGDRIRVRSVYTVLEEQYNQTKEVVTVGQPVTFAVPCYDYYKVCTVQDTSATAYVDIQQGLIGYEAKVSYSSSGIKWQSETGTYEDNYIKLYRETANDDWILKAVSTCVYDGNTYTSGQTIATLPYNQSERYYIYATAPTEIGGVYKTVDYGQTLFINVLDKTTLGGIQGILNAHQETELLAIGDEVEITENGVAETWLVTHINAYANHSVILSRKYLIDQTASTSSDYSTRSSVLNILSSVYSSIAEKDRQYIKDKTVKFEYWNNPVSTNQVTQKVWIPTRTEAGYTDVPAESSLGNINFALFSTQASRVKTIKNEGGKDWHLATNTMGYSARNDYILSTGAVTSGQSSPRVLPFIMLTADS